MLDLLLNEAYFLALLGLWAIAAPVAAWLVLKRTRRGLRRPWIALGASGPGVLLLWLIYNGVLAIFGFASIVSMIVLIAGAVAIGVGVGWWIRDEPPVESVLEPSGDETTGA